MAETDDGEDFNFIDEIVSGHMKDLRVQDQLLVFMPMQRTGRLLIMLHSALLLLLLLLGFIRWLDVSILFPSFAEKNTLRTL